MSVRIEMSKSESQRGKEDEGIEKRKPKEDPVPDEGGRKRKRGSDKARRKG